MKNEIYNITIEDFAKIFKTNIDDIPQGCKDIIKSKDFRYHHLTRKERDFLILDILKKINNNFYSKSGMDQNKKWEIGWQEILEGFINSGYNKEALIPQYNKKNKPIMLCKDYVMPCDENFENNFIELLRVFIFEKYLKDKNNIYDFGCGSCYHLLEFAKMDPEKNYYGYDWVEQPSKIIDKIREKYKYNVYGGIFNMFFPDYNLKIEEDSVAITIGSLEQLGTSYKEFFDFLFCKPFSRYVHVNSIIELYDVENHMLDYFIYNYEKSRNYCDGFFKHLLKMESKGLINIIKMDRVECGGLYNDGYSITVWEKK